jgi:hypothetical protein
MRRSRSIRLLAAVALVGATALTSGCVSLSLVGFGPQADIVGDYQVKLRICATGAAECPTGPSQTPAIPGNGQILIGARLQANVSLPSSFSSSGPEALAFTDSPTYAAELQRLDPAEPGTRWVGFISAVTNYSNVGGPQSFPLTLPFRLAQGADGSPFTGKFETEIFAGGRTVTDPSPASRPVVCGASLTTVFDEDPSPSNDVYAICGDSGASGFTSVRDLGVLAGASASGSAGGLAVMGFTLRYAGPASSIANFGLTATTTLPGATLAVTPGDLTPASDSTAAALVAIGVPAGARAGTYDVTLTARLANGQTRTRTGRLTVTGAGGGGTTGAGATVRLKLTTILPRGLSAAAARRSGIAVLIGANRTGNARVQLFQGTGRKNRKPKAGKGVRLRVPGPTRVVLKSAKLTKGAYKVVITSGGRTFVRRAALTK